MAHKETGPAGKAGKAKIEEGQRKLTMGGKEEGRSVTLKVGEEKYWKEERARMRQELKEMLKEVKGMKEARKKVSEELEVLKAKVRLYEERIEKLEERVEELEVERKERMEVESQIGERAEARGGYSLRSRTNSVSSIGSWSRMSEWSGFSESEVGKIRKWVIDKDKEVRKNNIVMRGVKIPREIERDEKGCREWAEALIKEKVGVEGKVTNCRENGTIILMKLENEDYKREIMRNKYKLKGGNIYIENDLSWEERKVQEKLHRWTKEQKEKSVEVRAGRGRVRVNGVWKLWTEIEMEIEKEKEKGRRERGERNEQDFK